MTVYRTMSQAARRRARGFLAPVLSNLLYALALTGTLLLSWVPAALLDPAAARVGRRLYRRDGARQRQLRANLRVAMGPEVDETDIDSTAAEVYASYGRYMAEYFTMGWPDLWRRRGRVLRIASEPMDALFARGQGVVLFGIHGGNWDMAAADCVRTYGAFHSAGELVEPAWLGRLVSGVRRRAGMQLYDAMQAGRPLLRALSRGQVVGLVADRAVIGDSVEVTLCERRARVPKGPVALAIMTGAPLVPTAMERAPDGVVRIEFWPPVDLSDLTRSPADLATGAQRMADQLTKLIRRGYRSWYALQPIWIED